MIDRIHVSKRCGGWTGLLLLAALVMSGGCTSVPAMPDDIQGYDREMSHGYALVHTLASKNSGVDKILIIRGAPTPTKDIINRIAAMFGELDGTLRDWADSDPALVLDHRGLPVIEAASRETVEQSMTQEMLWGGDFELRLLMSQTESLNYGWGLLSALAGREKDEKRSKTLSEYARQCQSLRKQVIERLASLQKQ